jgi:eukaryotic-like serine/threonine-protein kinase
LPFDAKTLREVGIDYLRRIIREEEPKTPSTRLSSLGEKAKEVAKRHGTDIGTLAKRLHKELEWIPLKAMRKESTRRYRSASELADDIRNYLNGAPLIAGPESVTYRIQKFVRRHAGVAAASAAFVTTLLVGLVVILALYVKAEDARRKEAAARTQAEQQRAAADHAKQQAQEAQRIAENQRQKAEKNLQTTRRLLYCSNINRAGVVLADGGIGTTLRQLEACPRDLRGWEWHYLWNALGSMGKIVPLGIRSITLAISPDHKRIASSYYSGHKS